MSLAQRVKEISRWAQDGGILIIGYRTFKDLVVNKRGKGGATPLASDTYKVVQEALLNKTKLVVADEAHTFKNRTSQISNCVNQIQTLSRVAMTGSPLMNNLSEYYALVDWISPRFLGSPTEFRAAYEEPIKDGLYEDSTTKEYRQALKKLKALQDEMEPKVHRMDFSVLHGSLHGKTEFMIQLSFTDIQNKLYQIFVDAILGAVAQ